MLSSLFMAAFAAQTSKEGFSKLQTFMQQLIDWGVGAGGHIIGAILIFVVRRSLISLIKKLLSKPLMERHIDVGIQSLIKSLVDTLLTILLIIAVIGKLGAETTSFAVSLASADVAVGMALSGNLQNFAGGLIVLSFRPFRVGDWIENQGVSGTVCEIQIFHTTLIMAGNKVIYIPNGALSSGTVTDYSCEEMRRVDWVIGVEYGENYDRVESTVRRILAADSRIPNIPEPFVALHVLDVSSVNVVIRVWVKNSDYWGVRFDMNKAIYTTFNKEGIGFPFPQLTVHQAKD